MPEIHVTWVGAMIAFAFLLVVGSILSWMLNPPEAVKMTLASAHHDWSGSGDIIVPLNGSNLSRPVLELAAEIAQREGRRLLLLYVVEIPMALPPNADLPNVREYGEELLIRYEGMAQRLGVDVDGKILRARNPGSAIVQVAREMHARMIVIPARQHVKPDVVFGRTVEHIFRLAPCDVIIYRPANTTADAFRQPIIPEENHA